jgi:hypothetical protein
MHFAPHFIYNVPCNFDFVVHNSYYHRFQVTSVAGSYPIPTDRAVALLQEAPLRELIAARVVSGVVARGGNGGFVLEIQFGDRSALLANARGSTRTFASLATVAVLLQRLGHPCFEVDATHYIRGRVRAAQPLRSASMKAGKLPEALRRPVKKSSVERKPPNDH